MMNKLMLLKPIARTWTWIFGKLLPMIERPRPVVFSGSGAINRLCESAENFSAKKILLVTDAILQDIGLIAPIVAKLTEQNISVEVFAEVLPDPSFDIVDKAVALGKKHHCDSVFAVGGGSVIDAAKVVALALSNSIVESKSLAGQFKAKKSAVTLFIVPTTAGTGAEVTMAAVISDSETHTKKLVIDTKLIPVAVALDAEITAGAPAKLTAIAGIDALSHAIEGYIGRWTTAEVETHAETAVAMIFQNINIVCDEPSNIKARENMILASHLAGLVINRSAAGYVHAISHQIGSLYKLPHGSINAAIMPDVLKFSKDKIQDKIAKLAIKAGLGNASQSDEELFTLFIDGLQALNTSLGLDNTLNCIEQKDMNTIIEGAMLEANTTYGVPRYMNKNDIRSMLFNYTN